MNISSYLPSKKIRIGILVVIILLLAFGVYALFFKNSGSGNSKFIDVVAVENAQKTAYTLDSDNDGAYDWEEALWPELDPNNPDSDGDGVLDGKYIQSKKAIQERQRLGGEIPESNLTETQKLGRSALTALLAIAQSGDDLDPESQQKFRENISAYISDLTLGTLYTRDQLALVENTKEKSYAYRTRMMTLFRTYPVAASDIELLVNATDNPLNFQGQVRSAAKKYNDYLVELNSLEVPYAIAGRHTELLNNISQISAGFNNLLQEEVDDLVSLSIIVQVEDIMNEVADSIVKINTYFEIIEDEKVFN